MSFESVTIQVRRGSLPATSGWRQDCAIGDLITCSLSDTRGVDTYQWALIGRQEGSGAGGGGPEPIALGTAATCSFTLDLKGTYIVGCIINASSPTMTVKTAGVAILESFTDPLGRPLRMLGGGETDEDTSNPFVRQGWITMLNRWLLRSVGGGGGSGEFPGYYNLPPRPVGISNPGASELVSRGDHEHAAPTPISEQQSYLFTAKLAAGPALDMGQVSCMWLGYITCGPTLFLNFTEGPTGTFVRNYDGPLSTTELDGVDPDAFNHSGVSSMIGKTVLAYATGASDLSKAGPYIIDDVGGHYEHFGEPGQVFVMTRATLRRHPDFDASADFVTGMSWQIQTGNVYGTKYVQFTTATPINLGTDPLTFAFSDANPNPPVAETYALLTAAQLTQASLSTVESSLTIDSGDGNQLLYMGVIPNLVPSVFDTLAGTPGLATIAAGQFIGQCLAKVSTAATGSTTLRFTVYKWDGATSTELFHFTTTPVTTPAYVEKQVSGAITSQDIAGCTLTLVISATTSSPSLVTLSVIVNDASHTCRISLPVAFSISDSTTLAGAYSNGVAGPDQTATVNTAKGGGVVIDASTASVTGDGAALEVKQSASYATTLVVSRRIGGTNPGPNLQFTRARGTYAAPVAVATNDELGTIDFYGYPVNSLVLSSRIVSRVSGVGASYAVGLDFYVTPRGGALGKAIDLSGDGPGSNTVMLFYNGPQLLPAVDHTGSLGASGGTWSSLRVDTAAIVENIRMGGAMIGGGADKTILLPNTATMPAPQVDQVYLGSVDFGPGAGSNHAVLSIAAEESVESISGQTPDTLVPIRYNGSALYLFATLAEWE